MIVKIQVIDDSGKIYQGTLMLSKQIKSQTEEKKKIGQIQGSKKVLPSEIIYRNLYQKKFFQEHKSLPDVEKKLNDLGYHYKKGSILMALKAAEYLIKSGKRRNYKFAQKFPPQG
jgi:hypothetical protein